MLQVWNGRDKNTAAKHCKQYSQENASYNITAELIFLLLLHVLCRQYFTCKATLKIQFFPDKHITDNSKFG